MIPREVVDEILSKTDIASLVGQRVTLKRAGQVFKGLCPFHAEKTPSFSVSPRRGTYHCFGCGAGGDALSFLQAIDGVTFREAAEELAGAAGVDLPQGGEQDAGEVGRMAAMRRRYLDLLARAQKMWAGALWGERGGKARAYLAARGVSEAEARAWGLGLAVGGLPGKMSAAGVSREDQVLSGLVSVDDEGRVGDRFKGRLVFPVRDAWGRVIGFSGRTLDDVCDDGQPREGGKVYGPKYVNSPETPWYKKGDVLLGLDRARDAMRKNGGAVLVEGNFDVIAAQRAGLGAVAPCGTALTPQQARALARVTDTVTVAFDGDKAGREASVRAVEVLKAAGLRVKVASLPQGLDPATMDGRDLDGVVFAAVSGLQFVLEQKIAHAKGKDVETRVEAKDAAMEVLAQEPDENIRRHFADWVAQRLGLYVAPPRFDVRAERAREEAQAQAERAQAKATVHHFNGLEARLVRLLAQSPLWHVEFVEAGLIPTLQDEAMVLFIELAGQMGPQDGGWAKAARRVEQETGREGVAAQLAVLAARAEAQALDGEAFTGAVRLLVDRYIREQARLTVAVPVEMRARANAAYVDLMTQMEDAVDWVSEPWMQGATPTPEQDAQALARMASLFGGCGEDAAEAAVDGSAAMDGSAAVVGAVGAVVGVEVGEIVGGFGGVVGEGVVAFVEDAAAVAVLDERPAREVLVRGAGVGAAALEAPRATPPTVAAVPPVEGGRAARMDVEPSAEIGAPLVARGQPWRIVEDGKGRVEIARFGGAGVDGLDGGVGLDDGWDAVAWDAPKIARAGP